MIKVGLYIVLLIKYFYFGENLLKNCGYIFEGCYRIFYKSLRYFE